MKKVQQPCSCEWCVSFNPDPHFIDTYELTDEDWVALDKGVTESEWEQMFDFPMESGNEDLREAEEEEREVLKDEF